MTKPYSTLAPLGRAALITVLACWALFLLINFGGGMFSHGFRSNVAPLFGYGSYIGGVTLAALSFVRREPKKLAIITLVILLTGPALFFFLALLVWFGYGLGIG